MWLQLSSFLDQWRAHLAVAVLALGGVSVGAWRMLRKGRRRKNAQTEADAATGVAMRDRINLGTRIIEASPDPMEVLSGNERVFGSDTLERLGIKKSTERDLTALSRATPSETILPERGLNFRFEGPGHVDGALLRNTPIQLVFSDRLSVATHTAFSGKMLADVISKESGSLTLVLTPPTGVELKGAQVLVAKFAAGSLVKEVAFDIEVKNTSAAVVDLHIDFFAAGTLLYGLPISIAVSSSEVGLTDRDAEGVRPKPIMVDLDVADAEGGTPGLLLSMSVGIDGLSMTLIQNAGGAVDALLTGRHPELTAPALQTLLDQIRNELGSDFFNPSVWTSADPGHHDWMGDSDLLGCCERVASAGSLLYQAICRSDQCRSIFEYINTRDTGTRLTVASSDISLPLELIYPRKFSKFSPVSERNSNPVAPQNFWGVRFALETLQSGPGDYRDMRKRHWLALPEVSFNLNSTITTIQSPGPMAIHRSFAERLQKDGVQCSLKEDCESMRKTLLTSASTAGVIYVYCHGAGAMPGAGASELLQLDYNCAVRPMDIVPGNQFASAPVIILNACLAGSTSPLMFTGFLKAFRAQGALGVIATTFYVPILFGATFGATLIESCLTEGPPLSEKLRRLRQAKAANGNLAPLFYSVQCQLDV